MFHIIHAYIWDHCCEDVAFSKWVLFWNNGICIIMLQLIHYEPTTTFCLFWLGLYEIVLKFEVFDFVARILKCKLIHEQLLFLLCTILKYKVKVHYFFVVFQRGVVSTLMSCSYETWGCAATKYWYSRLSARVLLPKLFRSVKLRINNCSHRSKFFIVKLVIILEIRNDKQLTIFLKSLVWKHNKKVYSCSAILPPEPICQCM